MKVMVREGSMQRIIDSDSTSDNTQSFFEQFIQDRNIRRLQQSREAAALGIDIDKLTSIGGGGALAGTTKRLTKKLITSRAAEFDSLFIKTIKETSTQVSKRISSQRALNAVFETIKSPVGKLSSIGTAPTSNLLASIFKGVKATQGAGLPSSIYDTTKLISQIKSPTKITDIAGTYSELTKLSRSQQLIKTISGTAVSISKKVLETGSNLFKSNKFWKEAPEMMSGMSQVAAKSGILRQGLKWGAIGAVATGISGVAAAATTGPGKIRIGSAVSTLGETFGLKFVTGIGQAMIVQGHQQMTEAADWLGFMAEDLFQPVGMQIGQLMSAGMNKEARELNTLLGQTVTSFGKAAKSVDDIYSEIADAMGVTADSSNEEIARIRQLAILKRKSYELDQKTMTYAIESREKLLKEQEEYGELFDPIKRAADKAGISVIAMSDKLHILSTTAKAIERDRGIASAQLAIEQEKYGVAQRKFGLIADTRFIGEVGMQRDIASSQNVAQLAQLSMMRQFGVGSEFGQAQSRFGLEQLAGSFTGMEIQKSILGTSRGTVDYDKYTKELMEHDKAQKIAAINFQLKHKDEITAYEETKINLQELSEVVSMTQLEYETSFGYMRTQVQLTAQEINDNLLAAEGLLFEGAQDASIALKQQAYAMEIATEAMKPYQTTIRSLDSDMLILNTEISRLYDNKGLISEVMSNLRNEAQDTINLVNEANDLPGGGGGGSRDDIIDIRDPEDPWGQHSISDLVNMLSGGGAQAYGAAAELRRRSWDGDYKGYHSGGTVMSDGIVNVQKGEQIISKEHSLEGQIVINVQNHFTGISVADQDSISEQISETVLNRIRESMGSL